MCISKINNDDNALDVFKLDMFSGHVLCNLIEIASRYLNTTNQRTRTFAKNTP